MASNNRKVPHRWSPKNADNRFRHGASRALQTGGSLHAKRRIDNKKIQETLEDMFNNIFDAEIIRSVAHSCGWKLDKSIEALIMLAEGREFPGMKVADSFNGAYQSQSVSCRDFNEKTSVSLTSSCAKDSNEIGHNLVSEASNSSFTYLPSIKSAEAPKSKSVVMNASQGTIKVMYKGNDAELLDDDADIVIEEENELDYDCCEIQTQSMYHFLSPFVSTHQNGTMLHSLACTSKDNVPSCTMKKLSKKHKNVSSLSLGLPTESPTKMPFKKTKHWSQLERIKKQINEDIKVMVLMRGCSGSGKTSLARHIIKSTYGRNEQTYIFSTDHYFVYVGNGNYKFDPRLLPIAHKWNQERVKEEVKKQTNPIIIDNTNLEAWEMEPYVKIAVEFGYNLEFLEPRTSWKYNPVKLELKNTHSVPRRNIENMLARFERDLTPMKLLSLFNLKYAACNSPPQYVSKGKFEINPSTCGTKKKLRTRNKDEGNVETLTHNNSNFVKPIEFSSILGSDIIANKEIKESLDSLVSEWNRSVMSVPSVEIKNTNAQKLDFNTLRVSENKEGSLLQSSKTMLERKEMTIDQDLDTFGPLYSEVENVEVDFNSGSSENSKDLEVASDDWEDENDENFHCDVEISYSNNGITEIRKANEISSEFMDYVLVLSDGTLLPKRSYDEDTSLTSKEGNRVWEYLLMIDDDSKLVFHPLKNNFVQNLTTNGISEVVNDKSKCSNQSFISSNNLLNQLDKDIITTGNMFLQKITHQEPPLECILFRDKNAEDVICSYDVFESVECKDVGELPVTKSSCEGLNLLVGAGATSLNIAFAGSNDSPTFQVSPLVLRSDLQNVKNQHDLVSETKNSTSLQNGTVLQRFVGEDSLQITLQNHGKETSQNNEHTNLVISDPSDNTQDHVKKDYFLNSGILEMEPQESEPDIDLVTNRIERNTNTDLSSFNSLFEEKHGASQERGLQDIEANSCDLKTNENNMNKRYILEEWAEGTNWDEYGVLTSTRVKSPDSCIPKPARTFKCQPSTESRSDKNYTEEKKIDIHVVEDGENWSAVEEPIASWEVNNELQDEQEKQSSADPQPQRKIFSIVSKSLRGDVEEKSADEELRELIDDGGYKENNDGDQQIPQSSSFNNAISIPITNIKVVDQITSENHIKVDSNQSILTDPLRTTILETNNIFDSSQHNTSNGTGYLPNNVIHSSTNTHHTDFILLGNVNMGSEVDVPGIKVLSALGRNILENNFIIGNKNIRKARQVLMLDKSSMTYDILSSLPEAENIKEQLKELINIFPHCQIEDLQEIFVKCNRDINWTVDLLLESASQGIEISTTHSNLGAEPEMSLLVDKNSSRESNELLDNVCSGFDSSSTMNSVSLEKYVKSQLSIKRNGKKDRTSISEMSLLLKKQLEENIVINDEHYSEHVSRIRKMRHGEIADKTETLTSSWEMTESLIETTHSQNLLSAGPSKLPFGQTCDLSISDSCVLQTEAPEWELNEEIKDTIDEEDETVTLEMNSRFAQQLHDLFGTASLPFNQDMMRMLNLPRSLARQLHYYMMEAEQNTYDLMMEEDEELARKVQLQEDSVTSETIATTPNPIPDLREIMDMEMALALYKADQKHNSESKEDLATKLTKSLLYEWFPSLPKNVLVDVFEAHNYSFEETIDVLLASTEEDNSVRTVMSPQARVAHERALLLQANYEGLKNKENLRSISFENEEVATQEKALQVADYYRSEASRHYNLRHECQNKAQKTYQKGLTAVASYYSQMANLHKERIEENNAKAASSLLLAHSLGNLSTTLDLHFLYVAEALQVLDMFLGHHIHQLFKSSQRGVAVFVITGRGARSSGGRSRIKPAVIQRLGQRGFRHEEVNPGLLKVFITKSAVSSFRTTI